MLTVAATASELQTASFEPQQRFENQESHTYTFNLALPVDPILPLLKVELEVVDPDFPNEGNMQLNDGDIEELFGELADGMYDEQTQSLIYSMNYGDLQQGENTLTIAHLEYQYFTINKVTVSIMYSKEAEEPVDDQLVVRVQAVEAQLVELEERVGLLEGFINRLKAFFVGE